MAPVQEVIVVAQDKREEETSMLLGLTRLAERGGGQLAPAPQFLSAVLGLTHSLLAPKFLCESHLALLITKFLFYYIFQTSHNHAHNDLGTEHPFARHIVLLLKICRPELVGRWVLVNIYIQWQALGVRGTDTKIF